MPVRCWNKNNKDSLIKPAGLYGDHCKHILLKLALIKKLLFSPILCSLKGFILKLEKVASNFE